MTRCGAAECGIWLHVLYCVLVHDWLSITDAVHETSEAMMCGPCSMIMCTSTDCCTHMHCSRSAVIICSSWQVEWGAVNHVLYSRLPTCHLPACLPACLPPGARCQSQPSSHDSCPLSAPLMRPQPLLDACLLHAPRPRLSLPALVGSWQQLALMQLPCAAGCRTLQTAY